jgi:hypothetical protein
LPHPHREESMAEQVLSLPGGPSHWTSHLVKL